jgi:hypothetical protein
MSFIHDEPDEEFLPIKIGIDFALRDRSANHYAIHHIDAGGNEVVEWLPPEQVRHMTTKDVIWIGNDTSPLSQKPMTTTGPLEVPISKKELKRASLMQQLQANVVTNKDHKAAKNILYLVGKGKAGKYQENYSQFTAIVEKRETFRNIQRALRLI